MREDEPLTPDEFASTLLRELAHASEQCAAGVHVHVAVPGDSAYQWADDEGDLHEVHLPTRMNLHLMHAPDEPSLDRAPEAVFRIESNGHIPSMEVTELIAEELYRESVRWGVARHVGWDSDTTGLPALPVDLEDIVASAITDTPE